MRLMNAKRKSTLQSMFLLVGWYVGWFVRLSLTNGKADQYDLYVKRTVRATELTWRGLFPDPATSRGHKGGQKLPLKISIPVRYL